MVFPLFFPSSFGDKKAQEKGRLKIIGKSVPLLADLAWPVTNWHETKERLYDSWGQVCLTQVP